MPCSTGLMTQDQSPLPLTIAPQCVAGPIRQGKQPASQDQRLLNAGKRRRAIFLQVHVRKSSIVQVHCKARRGKPVANQQGTNRFKDNLVFRFKKGVVPKNLRQLGTQVVGILLVAERSEYLNFGRQLSQAIHSQIIVPLQATCGEMISGEEAAAPGRLVSVARLPGPSGRWDLFPNRFQIREAHRLACPPLPAVAPIQSARGC
jgi:hypothetical protein